MRINLLPKELQPFNPRPIIAIVMLLLVVLVGPLLYSTHAARQRVLQLERQSSELELHISQLNPIASLAAERDSLRQQWNQVMAARPGQRQLQVTEHLEVLTALLPQQVYLTEISINHGNLTMRAFAPDYQAVVGFMGALVASPYFGDGPRLSGLSGSPGGYSFSVAVAVVGGER